MGRAHIIISPEIAYDKPPWGPELTLEPGAGTHPVAEPDAIGETPHGGEGRCEAEVGRCPNRFHEGKWIGSPSEGRF